MRTRTQPRQGKKTKAVVTSTNGRRRSSEDAPVTLSAFDGSLLSLESRIMFDGAAVATAGTVTTEQVVQQQAEASFPADQAATGDTAPAAPTGEPPSPNTDQALFDALAAYDTSTARQEIVFLSPSVLEYQQLLDGISPNVEVIVLDPARDGVEQMAEVLAGRRDLDAIHIISHGTQAELTLGAARLTLESMNGVYADELAVIGQSLSEQADLLVYGCNFGQGDLGQQAAGRLAELTGADVAASTDNTGHADLGGDWDLEQRAGEIETALVLSDAVTREWMGLLAENILESYEPIFSDMSDQAYEVKQSQPWGQTFVYDSPGATYTVNRIGLVLYRDTAASSQVTTVSLRSTWNGPVIASGQVSSGSLGTTEAWVHIDLTTPATLTDNATYYVRVDSNTDSGKVYVGVHDAGLYANGDLINTTGGSETPKDLAFRIIEATANTDPVIVNLLGASLAYAEGDGAVVIDQGVIVTVIDLDSADFDTGSLVVSFVAGSDSAEDVLAIRNEGVGGGQIGVSGSNITYGGVTIGTFAGGSGGTNLIVTFNSSATPAAAQALIRNITYQNTDTDNPTTGARTVRFELTDGDGGSSGPHDTTITVTAVNDAPVNTVPGAQVVAEDTPLALGGVSVTDVDGNLSTVQLAVSNGTVTVTLSGGASISAGANGSATLTLLGTQADINATLATLLYQGTLNYSGPDTLTVTTTDTNGATDIDTVALTVTPVNDAPVLDTTGVMTFTTITEDDTTNNGNTVASIIASAGGDRITDVDSGALEGIAVTGLASGNGTWQYSANGGAVWNNVGTVSDAAALLLRATDRVRFVPDTLNADSASISFRAWDQTTGVAGTKIAVGMTVRDQFNSTSYSSNDGTQSWSGAWIETDAAGAGPGGGSIQISSNELRFDVDTIGDQIAREVDLSAATSATLTFSFNNTLTGTDQVELLVSNDGGGSYVTLPNGVFSSALNIGSGDLSFDLSAFASSNTRIQFLVTNTGGNDRLYIDNLQITYTTATSATSADTETATITVTSVNDAPAGTSTTVTTAEDTSHVFTVANFGFTDVDAGAFLTAVRIDSLPLVGNLTLSGVGVAAGQVISRADITAGNLVFTPAANANGLGYASFTFSVRDAGGPAFDPTPKTLTVDVTPVNDAPLNTVPGAQGTPQNTSLVFSAGNGNAITVADADVGAGALQVTLTATNGTVLVGPVVGVATVSGNGTATVTIAGSLGDVNSALSGMSFTPDLNYNGAAGVLISTDDQGNTGAGGARSDTDIITITVANNVPAAVSMSAGALTYTENDPPIVVDPNLTVADPDNAVLNHAHMTITGGYVNGEDLLEYVFNPLLPAITASWNAAAGELTLVGAASAAEYQQALRTVTYRNLSEAPSAALRTITVEVEDGISVDAGSFANRTLNVTQVNDAPVNTVPGPQVVTEDTPLALGGVSVTDVDGNLSTMQLAVANGTVTVTLQGSASITAGVNGTNTVTLAGSEADINATLATLVYQGTLNYIGPETLTITSGDAGSATDLDTVTIIVTPVNDAPVITSNGGGAAAVVNVPENQASATNVTSADVDGGVPTYSIIGGADAALFTLDATTGALTFNNVPDFEAPVDAGADNVYDVTVQVADGNGGTDIQALSIVVTDVNEGLPPLPPPPPIPPPSQVPQPPAPPLGGTPPTGGSPPSQPPIVVGTPISPQPNPGTPVFPVGLDNTPGGTAPPPSEVTRAAAPKAGNISGPSLPFVRELRGYLEERVAPLIYTDEEVKKTFAGETLDRAPAPLSEVFRKTLGFVEEDLRRATDMSDSHRQFVVRVTNIGGMTLTAGVVTWLLRAGSLLASLTATLPAWRHFDPLPVVLVGGRERRKRKSDTAAAAEHENKQFRGLRDLLDRKGANEGSDGGGMAA